MLEPPCGVSGLEEEEGEAERPQEEEESLAPLSAVVSDDDMSDVYSCVEELLEMGIIFDDDDDDLLCL